MEEFKIISLPKEQLPGSTQPQDNGGFRVISTPDQQSPQGGILGSASRTALGVPLRFLESALGSVGDIRETAKGLISYATGGRSNYEKEPTGIPVPPTSESLRDISRESRFSHLTEPQGYVEEFLHDVASDLGSFIPSMLLLGKGKLPFAKVGSRIAQFAKGSALGSGLKGIANYMGLDEGWQSLAKIGGQLGYNLLGYKTGLDELKKSQYKEVEQAVEGATHNSRQYHNSIKGLYDSVNEGASKDKKKLLGVLRPIVKATESGKTSVPKVLSLIKDINGHFTDKELLDRSKKVLGEALNDSYKFIADYDPEIYKKLARANDIHKGFNDVSAIGAYLNKHTDLENIAKNPITKTVVWGNLLKGKPGAFAKGVATAGGLAAARGAEEFRNLLRKSPDAWKALELITRSAIQDNTPNFIKGVHRLDRIIDRFQNKED